MPVLVFDTVLGGPICHFVSNNTFHALMSAAVVTVPGWMSAVFGSIAIPVTFRTLLTAAALAASVAVAVTLRDTS